MILKFVADSLCNEMQLVTSEVLIIVNVVYVKACLCCQ